MATSIKAFYTAADGGQPDVRRFKLDPPLEHAVLAAKAAALFGEPTPAITWTDEDGDSITIGNTDDLVEAARSCPGTLKIYVAKGTAPAAEPEAAESDGWEQVEEPAAPDAAPAPAPVVEARAEQPPVDFPTPPPAEVAAEPAQPVEEPAVETPVEAPQPAAEPAAAAAPPPEAEPEVVHPHVQCDATGMFPIVGVRWHKIGADYDLCAAAFDALPYQSMKAGFEKIERPGATPVPYVVDPAAEAAEAAAPAIHHGVTCDLSGMSPILGKRWHLIGHNYDVCEAEFEKLPEESKRRFELVAKPGDLPRPYGYPLRFDRNGDAGEQAAQLLRTVLTALQDNYSVEIDLVPRGAEAQHRVGPVQAEIPVDVTTGADGVRVEAAVSAAAANVAAAEAQAQAQAGQHHGHFHPGHGRWHGPFGFHHGHHGMHHGGKGRGGRNRRGRAPVEAGDGLPTETMAQGSHGEGVQQLQAMLLRHGYLSPDSISRRRGFFGPRTVAAVRSFQAHNRIGDRSTWGVVDAATREALLKLDSAVPEPTAPPAEPAPAPVPEPAAAEPAVAAEPAPEPAAEPKKWAEQLEQLAMMGFVNEELMMPILDRTNGHVDAVISALLD